MARKSKNQIDMDVSGLAAITPEVELEIPAELQSDEERELYIRLLKANPSAHLFTDSVVPLMIQYVRHSIAANEIAALLRNFDKAADPRLFLALLKSQQNETMAMNSITTKLRMTGSSIAGYRVGLVPKDEGPKPWEFGK